MPVPVGFALSENRRAAPSPMPDHLFGIGVSMARLHPTIDRVDGCHRIGFDLSGAVQIDCRCGLEPLQQQMRDHERTADALS